MSLVDQLFVEGIAAKAWIDSVEIGSESQSVKLKIGDLKPVDQLHLILKIKRADGSPFEEEVYWTIHNVPTN